MSAASLTHRAPLQQGGPLSRWRRSSHLVSATIGLEDFEILLKLLPGDVTGVGVRDAGEPVIAFALSQYLLSISGSPIMPPTIGVGPRITRVVQRADRGRCGQRPENRRRAVAQSRGEEKALMAKYLDRLTGGPHPRERLKEVEDRFPDLRVGVEHHVAGFIVDKAGWKRAAILAASHFVQDPAAQSGFDDMEFGLAHRSLEAEQEPVVEAGGIVRSHFLTPLFGRRMLGPKRSRSRIRPIHSTAGAFR